MCESNTAHSEDRKSKEVDLQSSSVSSNSNIYFPEFLSLPAEMILFPLDSKKAAIERSFVIKRFCFMHYLLHRVLEPFYSACL